jgi:methionyl-tRNA synthetase
MAEALRLGATLLPAVMPSTTDKIYAVIGCTPAGTWRERLVWGETLTGAKVAETAILFPRPQAPEAGAAKG